jgi:hypothetical protein
MLFVLICSALVYILIPSNDASFVASIDTTLEDVCFHRIQLYRSDSDDTPMVEMKEQVQSTE